MEGLFLVPKSMASCKVSLVWAFEILNDNIPKTSIEATLIGFLEIFTPFQIANTKLVVQLRLAMLL